MVTRTAIETAAQAFVADHLPDGTLPEPGPGWRAFEAAFPGMMAAFNASDADPRKEAESDG